MAFLQKLGRSTPWTFVAIVGLSVLSGVDFWRESGVTRWPIVRGSLPNLVAVPILAFGFLMMKFPLRQPHDAALRVLQRRWFWGLWGTCLGVVVSWEFLQLRGNLIFDPLDLLATGIGAALAVPIFYWLEPRSWIAVASSRAADNDNVN